MIFSKADKYVGNRFSDSSLYSILTKHADLCVEQVNDEKYDWLNVAKKIASAIDRRRPIDLFSIAADLSMHHKALQRCLQKANLDFKSIKEEIRRERSRFLLESNGFDIEDTAQRLELETETLIKKYRSWYQVDLA